MKTTTPAQITIIHTLLGKAGVKKEDKPSVISEFTGKRTTSSREMTVKEAEVLISHLKNLDGKEPKAEKMRRKLISQAHEMGWKIEGSTQINMKRVHTWCKKYGYLHKRLDDYTYEELPKLLSQFDEVYKQFINNINK